MESSASLRASLSVVCFWHKVCQTWLIGSDERLRKSQIVVICICTAKIIPRHSSSTIRNFRSAFDNLRPPQLFKRSLPSRIFVNIKSTQGITGYYVWLIEVRVYPNTECSVTTFFSISNAPGILWPIWKARPFYKP